MTRGIKKEDSKQVIEQTPSGPDMVGGKIEMAEDVVATIAGLTARDIPGIHGLGKSRLISMGDKPTRGVAAEVGKSEAAVDLEVIIEHGCDIRSVAGELRKRIASDVDKMTGRKVVEVNIDVIDIKLPEEEKPVPPVKTPRVK
jgi:uncharacterized alkaline shock family protein YloU